MSYPSFNVGEVLTANDMNNVAMWKITSVPVSGTVFSVNNCFSSNFTNYRVLIQGLTGASFGITMRMRVSGVDNTAAQYFSGNQFITWGGGTSGVYGDNGNTNWAFSYTTAVPNDWTWEFFQPNVAAPTGMSFLGHAPDTGRYGGGYHNVNTAYDGFTLTNTGGPFTGGRITVYGYRI